MYCKKCSGKVFVDLAFSENKNHELFCLNCGKRWFVSRRSPLSAVLNRYIDSVQGIPATGGA